jgi:hypothetical protein
VIKVFCTWLLIAIATILVGLQIGSTAWADPPQACAECFVFWKESNCSYISSQPPASDPSTCIAGALSKCTNQVCPTLPAYYTYPNATEWARGRKAYKVAENNEVGVSLTNPNEKFDCKVKHNCSTCEKNLLDNFYYCTGEYLNSQDWLYDEVLCTVQPIPPCRGLSAE